MRLSIAVEINLIQAAVNDEDRTVGMRTKNIIEIICSKIFGGRFTVSGCGYKSHITVCGQIIQLLLQTVFLGVCQKIGRIIQHINVAGFLIGSGNCGCTNRYGAGGEYQTKYKCRKDTFYFTHGHHLPVCQIVAAGGWTTDYTHG